MTLRQYAPWRKPERDRLVAAVASGGNLEALVAGLRAREERLTDLRREVEAARLEKRVGSLDQSTTRRELLTLARDWRKVLATDPNNARPIVSALLDGRVTITPTGTPKQWELQGRGTLNGLFSGQIFPSDWRPHRDSRKGGNAFLRHCSLIHVQTGIRCRWRRSKNVAASRKTGEGRPTPEGRWRPHGPLPRLDWSWAGG